MREADALGWHPRLLATGAAGDGSLLGAPAAFAGRIFLALPSLPAPAPEAARRYAQLAADHALPREDVSAQLTVLAAAEVLGEALRRTGRELTRERLIAQLESLRGFTTGYTPPVTFGPARRLGAHGAYVVPVDLAAHGYGAAQWMEGE